jgi:hypothetical protein
VYVYVRSGTLWTFQTYIKAPNANAGDYFGRAVSLSADKLAIGAYGEASCSTSIATSTTSANRGCNEAGAVYVYVRSGTVWSFEAYIKAPNANADDRFGSAVSLSGDTLAGGAIWEDSCSTSITTSGSADNGCSAAGAVYVVGPPCAVGHYSDPSTGSCTACLPGTVQPLQLAGYQPCNNCAAGEQQHVEPDSAEPLPRPRPRRRTSEERDEMRVYTSRGSREHPPSHKLTGRAKQMSQRVNPEVQDEPTRPSRGVVGRARGNSLAEEPSSCWLPMRPSAEAGASEAGRAQASGVSGVSA